MASSSSASSSSSLPATLRDPKSLFYQKVGIRRSIILAYWILILLALPLWWYTTSIERLTLPSRRVQQLAQSKLQLPISICLEEGSNVPDFYDVQRELSARILRDPQRWKGLGPYVIESADCNAIYNDTDTYIVKSGSGTGALIRHRQLEVPSSSTSSDVVDVLSSLIAPYSTSSDPDHRVVQYSPHYRLAFSLLNEDAAAGDPITDWNIQSALQRHIDPITRRLSALHNFTIESQVQFHAPLAFSPLQVEDSWGITSADLTVFVNSAEWTLSSSSSSDPVLHFILFIPSAQRRPLRILTNGDQTTSPSSAFLVPQWGGIVILNPTSPTSTGLLPAQDLHNTFSSFSNQLQGLLGVAPLPNSLRPPPTQAHSPTVLSEWQLDALTRRRTLENTQGSQDTLQSIIKLVGQIENMPVGESVRDDVEDALEALDSMYTIGASPLFETFSYSAKSYELASRAFFNPGMLALLYFPAEHTYAVYTPLFASALIPLIVAALREFLAWKRERKERKEARKEAEKNVAQEKKDS